MQYVYTHAMTREARQQIIAQLLRATERTGHIQSQDALRQLLADRGIRVTQATLSRDLRDMGVFKGPAGYALGDPWRATPPVQAAPEAQPAPASLTAAAPINRVLQASILDAEPAANFAVLKTPPGHAQLVAVEIDQSPPPGAVGTIAGDDTIFIACASSEAAEAVCTEVLVRAGLLSSAEQAAPSEQVPSA